MQQEPGSLSDRQQRYAIEVRAYQLWEQRGRPWGTPEIDWMRAESELQPAHPDAAAQAGPAFTAAKVVGSVLGSVAGLVTSFSEAFHSAPDR